MTQLYCFITYLCVSFFAFKAMNLGSLVGLLFPKRKDDILNENPKGKTLRKKKQFRSISIWNRRSSCSSENEESISSPWCHHRSDQTCPSVLITFNLWVHSKLFKAPPNIQNPPSSTTTANNKIKNKKTGNKTLWWVAEIKLSKS